LNGTLARGAGVGGGGGVEEVVVEDAAPMSLRGATSGGRIGGTASFLDEEGVTGV